ncbi:MAG: spore protease YyaC [Bacillota bacterium]
MVGFPFISRSKPLNRENRLPSKLKIHYQDPLAVHSLSTTLCQYLQTLSPDMSRPIIIVSIGTDRSTGDSLGPLVGSKLQNIKLDSLYVYGTLDDPIHAGNLAEKLEQICTKHPSPIIIAIDASLGQTESIGYITLMEGAVKPGAGVNKNLPEVGDLHFTGVVNVGGYMEYFVLQNTRLSMVMKMAGQIAAGIYFGYRKAMLTCTSAQTQTV